MSHLNFHPSSKSRDTKTRTDIKNPARQNLDSLKISSRFPIPIENGRGDFENVRISNFQRHVTLILDRAIWHTVVHHASTSTYTPNFIQIAETLWTDGRTDVRTDIEDGFRDASTFFTHCNPAQLC